MAKRIWIRAALSGLVGSSVLTVATAPQTLAATDPVARPEVATELHPSFPSLGTPGYTEWQGSVSSARQFVQVPAPQQITAGGLVTANFSFEYHGVVTDLCVDLSDPCTGLVHPHSPTKLTNFMGSPQDAFIGLSPNAHDYGTQSYRDQFHVAGGPIYSRLGYGLPVSKDITEEVAARSTRVGASVWANVWFTIIRTGTVTYRLPATMPFGRYYFGLNNSPSAAISMRTAIQNAPPNAYQDGPYETQAWFNAGSLPALDGGPSPTTYVALGDSYSAGEGLQPYDKGTDTPKNQCNRSRSQSYPKLLAAALKMPLDMWACSSETLQAYSAPGKGSHEPAQSGHLNANTAIVTLTLGGNDLDWTGTLLDCLTFKHEASWKDPSPNWTSPSMGDCAKKLSDAEGARLESIRSRTADMYRDILTRAPNAHVYVLGYPSMFPERAKKNRDKFCAVANPRLSLPIAPFFKVKLGLKPDVEKRVLGIQAGLNAAVQNSVNTVRASTAGAAARLTYVDVSSWFGGPAGHTVDCGDNGLPKPWINALRVDNLQLAKSFDEVQIAKWIATGKGDVGKRVKENLMRAIKLSFHPTARGQQEMAAAVRAAMGLI